MLLAFRFLGLLIFAAGAHFGDGLALIAIACGALVGWRGAHFLWMTAPILGLAAYSSEIYATATGPGKLSGALGNFFFEILVFAFLAALGAIAGRLVRSGTFPARSQR